MKASQLDWPQTIKKQCLSIQQHKINRRYFDLCWHTRGHANAAKRCAGIHGRCGMHINVKKTYLLVIENDIGRREPELVTLFTINGETLECDEFQWRVQTSIWDIGARDTAIRKQLRKWSGKRSLQHATWPLPLVVYHPLTPELATELFTSKAAGVFCSSAALIEWSKSGWTTWHDCTSKPKRTLGTCHGQRQVLPLSLRKHKQVRRAHCSW